MPKQTSTLEIAEENPQRGKPALSEARSELGLVT